MKKTKRLLLIAGVLAGSSFLPVLAESKDTLSVRPDHINNAETPYFPQVFNQDGGSCGSASRIGYMFTHEINAFRGTDASLPENIYPTHFTWLLTNSHSGKEGMAIANGVPNSIVYGGTTYSKLFGNQDCANPDFGWMQGYDKWYSAMFNRISCNSFSPLGVDTEKGREFIKNWLWNHQGDSDFYAGGICGIGVASACKQAPIENDPDGKNQTAGVVGKKYVTRWGDGVDHALTIVGYDDRIVFDLDSNKIYGEKDKDECGAWIIVNSWGDGWANNGFIYCPYKYGFPVRQQEGGAWKPEFYHVRKNYRPLRTLKIRMAYSHRSELKLTVGISSDLNATQPDVRIELEHFKFAGDGRSDKEKNGTEAATPMLGKWADGKLHAEPMEFGYDLTDLSSVFDTRRPLKYFFCIERKKGSIGNGKIYACSVIDYEFDRKGIETPLTGPAGRDIDGQEEMTFVASVVQGEPLFAPANLHYLPDETATQGILAWNTPQRSHYPIKGYILFENEVPADTLPAVQTRFPIRNKNADYSIAALYSFQDTLSVVSARTPSVRPSFERPYQPHSLLLKECGFTIPDIFEENCMHATIEYWLKPYSWRNWNQSIGPGWGSFLIHANDDGSLSAGWDGENRMDTHKGLIKTDQWQHFAFVIAQDTLTAYINGVPADTLISNGRKGIGGFKQFPFGTHQDGALDGELVEVRIWKEARTPEQIKEFMYASFEPAGIPRPLAAYYRGETIGEGRQRMWRDFAGHCHAPIANYGQYETLDELPDSLHIPTEDTFLSFELPDSDIRAGESFRVLPQCSPDIQTICWDVPGAGVKKLPVKVPTLLFPKPGKQKITLTGLTTTGEKVKAVRKVNVLPAPVPDAGFQPIRNEILAGERISFQPLHPIAGYRYEWSLERSDNPLVTTQNAAATYETSGDYTVSLKVSNPWTGESAQATQSIHVKNVAPDVAFDVTPMIVRKGETVDLADRSRYMPTQWNWQLDSRRFTTFARGTKARLKMDVPGVYDITLTASNEEGQGTLCRKGVLTVCNADSKNGLNFSNPSAAVTTQSALWQGPTREMTIDWWMNPGAKARLAGIGHEASTWQIDADKHGRMTVYIDSLPARSDNGFVISGQWHHYAVAFGNGQVRFMRDGETCKTVQLKDKKGRAVQVPAFPHVRLGGEETPMNATIDEFRIWKKDLKDSLMQQYCNAPIDDVARAERADKLVLYYSFNQNGGDVRDLTSHNHTGKRTSFGPDGDAWGYSAGVFCLNFETPFEDISEKVLPPSRRPFATDGRSVNHKDSLRFQAFDYQSTGWQVENALETDSISTGLYVDRNKENALCVYTSWDGFAPRLTNHKLYCTVKLPAGKYELEVIPYQGFSAGSSRLLVAGGKGLPDLPEADTALASAPLSERRLPFILTRETEVSLGILFDLQGHSGIAIDRIVLHKATTGGE